MPSTCADALAVCQRCQIGLPPAAHTLLDSGAGETIKPDDARLQANSVQMVATSQMALQAAAQVAQTAGFTPYILGNSLEGESRDVAKVLAGR